MTPVLTVSQMRSLDHRAIGHNTAIGYSYMIKAGLGLLSAVRELLPDSSCGTIAVVCGKGNNGGDGYVVARLLLEARYQVTCFELFEPDQLKAEARLACDEYRAHHGTVLRLRDAGDLVSLSTYRLIIDAILGTGITKAPSGLIAQTIEAINNANVLVIAADTPSGLDCDSGNPYDTCIRATVTVTMGFHKIGFYFYPGRTLVGKLTLCDLEYPAEMVQALKPCFFLPTLAGLKTMVPPRKPHGSKFDHGVAFMLAGARGMTGSAALCSRAALRSGCGMVNLCAPHSVIPALCAQVVEVVLNGIAETAEGTPAPAALDQCLHLIKHAQAVCIGPGISHHPETIRLVRELFLSVDAPVLLDADGINAFKDAAHLLKQRRGACLITPHAGEWARLFGAIPVEPLSLITVLAEKSKEYRLTILYKGSPTMVADPSGDVFILPYGNSGMATAGSGDVLSGIITGLMAMGCSLTDAAVLGAYLHGEAGNAAAKMLGEYSMIAGDIVENIYKAFQQLLDHDKKIPVV